MFIVKFMGGLGNQLFQLNFLYFLVQKYPMAEIRVNTRSYMIRRSHGGFFLNFLKKKRFYIKQNYELITDETFQDELPIDANLIFLGYWQDKRFFEKNHIDFRLVMRRVIKFSEIDIVNSIPSNAVSIHVRRGDYTTDKFLGSIATDQYYQNAIDYFLKIVREPTFLVFTDGDENTILRTLDFHGAKVSFPKLTGNSKHDAFLDIFRMSLCSHHIIANSSFSWFGQYFNRNTNKIVVCPEYWVNQPCPSHPNEVSSLQDFPNIVKLKNILKISQEPKDLKVSYVCLFKTSQNLRLCMAKILNSKPSSFEFVAFFFSGCEDVERLLKAYAQTDVRLRIFEIIEEDEPRIETLIKQHVRGETLIPIKPENVTSFSFEMP